MVGRRASHADRRRGRKGFGAILAALVLVAGVVGWSVHVVLSDGDTLVDRFRAAWPGAQGGTANTSACAEQIAQAERVVARAHTGVASWREHVQARTDMLHGRMSAKEMETIWDRTRAQGPDEQQQFEVATARYTGTAACDRLAEASSTPSSEGCLARSRAARTAVVAARAVMADWRDHLHHMESFRDGGMSAGHAQKLWVAAWRKAPANITAFHDAEAALSAAPPCPASP